MGKDNGKFGELNRTSCLRFRSRRICSRPFWVELVLVLTALGKLGLWVYRKMEATVDDDKKFNAAVSKIVNCLMTKAALKINARFSGATIAHCRLLQPYFILLRLFIHILSSRSKIQIVPDGGNSFNWPRLGSAVGLETTPANMSHLGSASPALSLDAYKGQLSLDPMSKRSSLLDQLSPAV